MLKWRKKNFQPKAVCAIFTISIFFLFSAAVYAGIQHYYYLQVGSFQAAPKARNLAKKLSDINEFSVIRGEDISGLGYWYRVYLGPFSSVQEASQKQFELRKKGFFAEQAFVHKKTALIQSNLKEPAEVPSAMEEPAPTAAEKEDGVEPSPLEIKAAEQATMEAEKPTKELLEKGRGRNMGKGELAFGFRHMSIEVDTEITNRKEITSGGTREIPLSSINISEFPTSMYFSSIHIRLGLTDYLEVFADIGAAYDKISDPEALYGGGVRLNLFEITGQRFGDYYLALQGEYLTGDMTEEYQGSAGANWKKEADWEMFTARMEIGAVFSGFTGYVGGAYFVYSEDTERHKLTNLSPPLTRYVLQDELEEEDSFGFYCGGVFHILPNLLLNIEGQIVNQKSIFGALEYHF
jgi:hypothetical protein